MALLLGLAVLAQAATAQIVREKPGRINAENRKAMRADRKTDSPYKESHLDVSKAELKRGETISGARTEGRQKTDGYKKGLAPNAKRPGLFGFRKKGGKKKVKEEVKK